MTKAELIIAQYELNQLAMKTLVDDITEAESLEVGKDKVTPIKWLVGHLSNSAAYVLKILGVESDFDPKWSEMFEGGSKVSDDPTDYPPFSDIRAKFFELDGKIIETVRQLSDTEIERAVPEKLGFDGKPIAAILVFFAAHEFYHGGQIATIRTRLLGRDSPFGRKS